MAGSSTSQAALGVSAQSPEQHAEAAALAQALSLPLLADATSAKYCGEASALLQVSPQPLALQLTGSGAPGPVSVDFGASGMRHRRAAGHNELLGRAIGVGKKTPLRVLDATAGLGRDAFVLADLGAELRLCERNPVIAAMLRSGLQVAARSDDSWLQAVVGRMHLQEGDAMTLDCGALAGIDVIYLDPMFPQRDKKAAVKKEMAVFQLLLGSGDDSADALLAWALAQAVARVVVKRPRKAAPLAGRAPSHELAGKAVRFDVYALGPFT